MKGIRICGDCANYSYKKHKCLLGCNQESSPRSKFYDDCPLPDVVEVRHGRWISVDADVIFSCSECEAEVSTSWDYESDDMFRYCPCCGAKMDGSEKE